jgi:hypothetical protein
MYGNVKCPLLDTRLTRCNRSTPQTVSIAPKRPSSCVLNNWIRIGHLQLDFRPGLAPEETSCANGCKLMQAAGSSQLWSRPVPSASTQPPFSQVKKDISVSSDVEGQLGWHRCPDPPIPTPHETSICLHCAICCTRAGWQCGCGGN